jgi:hypothetical protein
MHFTYSDTPDFTELQQGDVLKKTPELLALIGQVHPHYASDKYHYFQVLTQSCDLVRRSGKQCKSRYVTLAAVRPLDVIIGRAIGKFDGAIKFQEQYFCSDRHKHTLKDSLNKIFNNNDTQLFFLKAEPDAGITIDCCTLLHLSISIKAAEHYETCLAAKIVELKENFRAKLGWLVGNLYSRVGTDDYVPSAIADQATYDRFVEEQMTRYVAWVPSNDFALFKKNAPQAQSVEDISERINSQRNKSRDSSLNGLLNVIAKRFELDDNEKATLRNLLAQHPVVQRGLG